VVHTYNHERFVDECLAAISKQTFADFEVVIVDDCSTDRTAERIRAWLPSAPVEARLFVNERNRGICASRNVALGQCRGEFVAGVSGDDFYEPDKLERQYRFFEQLDETAAAVFSNMRMIDEHGQPLGPWFGPGEPPAEGRIFEQLITYNYLPAPTILARRAALEEMGLYDETLAYEDFDMWLKLADRYEFRYLPAELVNYRVLASSLSRNPAYAAVRHETRARVLLRWYGRDPHTDDVIISRAWKNGRRALAVDPRRGRKILQEVYATRPSIGRRVGVTMAAIPGAGAVAGRAFKVADRLRQSGRGAG
jgi:glycosyltransferase involved in cell wall biosynthesis